MSGDLRVFIDDGPLGGDYIRVPYGPSSMPPPEITLRDALVPRGSTEEGGFTGYMPAGESRYALAGRQDDGTPIYRLVRES